MLPFIALAREFQRRGHDARLYVTAVFEPFAREAGLPFKALGSVEDYESLLRDPDINHPMRQLRVVARGLDNFGHAAFQRWMPMSSPKIPLLSVPPSLS